MYIEATILQNGNNVGFTNDTTVGVKANERVTFELVHFGDSGGATARINQISCS
jgi:hypothetical protein